MYIFWPKRSRRSKLTGSCFKPNVIYFFKGGMFDCLPHPNMACLVTLVEKKKIHGISSSTLNLQSSVTSKSDGRFHPPPRSRPHPHHAHAPSFFSLSSFSLWI